MYDQSFNPRTLSRCFKPEDFQKNRALSLDSVREKPFELQSRDLIMGSWDIIYDHQF